MRGLAIALALGVLVAPSRAWACSAICAVEFVPYGTTDAPAHLPANGAFVVVPTSSAGPVVLTLERTRAGTTESLALGSPVGLLAVPDPMPGDLLVLTAAIECAGGSRYTRSTTLALTATAPLPTTLGVLEVEGSRTAPVAVWDQRGSCTSDLASTVAPYTISLDPTVEPWRDALVEQAVLDGSTPWYPTPDARIAPRFVFARCVDPLPSQTLVRDTATGPHRLRVDATLRGLPGTISTQEVELELTCRSASSLACTPAFQGDRGAPLVGSTLFALALLARRWRRRPDRTVSQT